MLKFFFIPILISSFISLSSQANISIQIVQKLADEPKDRTIVVRYDDVLGGPSFCYTPVFSYGEGYIYLGNCSKQSTKFRYDVLGRISFNHNGKWLCITAPSSVTGIGSLVTKRWSNLIIRPCVINDLNQQWKLINHAFYTADGRFRVKSYGYYLYISVIPEDDYNHHLAWEMNDWESTIARPGNLSIKTFIAWLYVERTKWTLYYLQNGISTDESIDLYFNPENGHITQYDKGKGNLFCLTSHTQTTQDWSWVDWSSCTDSITKEADKERAWSISAAYNNEGTIQDYWGNILRVPRYGVHWGVPYTVKSTYLAKDTTNSPTSTFIFLPDINNWNRYLYANLGDNLESCPAIGVIGIKAKKKVKRGLPPTFELTDAWIGRLWQIAITTDPREHQAIGLCGVCLLQAYQMTLELMTQAMAGPTLHGGYFFDTAPDTNPFTTFEHRYPELAHRFVQIEQSVSDLDFELTETFATRMANVFREMAVMMLPAYTIRSTAMVFSSQARELIQRLLNEPLGTLGIIFLYRTNSTGDGVVGHSEVFLRVSGGVVIVPTNDSYSLDSFRDLLVPRENVEQVMERFTIWGRRELLFLQYIFVSTPFDNPFSTILSQYNCSGDGMHRRGSRTPPSTSSVNQCASTSGRCIE